MKQQPAPRVAGYCALCRSRCGAQFVVEGGRLTGVEPLAGHPTGGALCAKGRAGPELQYHPARLTRPLRRTRPRSDPDPGWVEVSWDEALGDIAARLGAIRAESGAHAVAFASASPGATALSDSLEWIERLVFAFGSPNFLTGVEICNWHRDHNHAFTFGTGIGMPDYANSDLVMLWGFNPGNVWLAQAQGVAAAQARGAKLLVIDPVRTRHARQADLWLPVRPGTDAALALGLARELIAQGRHDDDFVRRWTNAPFLIREDDGRPLTERDLQPHAAACADGASELKRERPLAWHLERGAPVALDTSEAMAPSLSMQLALAGRFVVETAAGPVACRPAMAHYMAACEPWTPQAVEAFTGVPAAQVREAARMIGDAGQRISYFSWTGIAQHANATQTDRAIALLYAITGSVDAPGGNLHLARAAASKINDRTLLDPSQAERALGLAQRPLGPPAHGWTLGADFHRAVVEGEPYRVRALVGFGANLLMSQPDSQAIRAALQGLEFQVHCDLFETPTARHADYLLPVQTPYEREGLRIGFEISAAAQHTVQLRPAVVAPAPGSEARADLDIVFDLAVRLGHGDLFFGGDVERGWNHALAPLGLTAAALRAQPQGMVRLPFVRRLRQYAEPSADGDMRKVRGFATPSRRVEIHASRFAVHGIPPVPEVVAPRARFDTGTPASTDTWPFTLCCAKSGYYCQSQHRGLPTLRAREPEPQARLHPTLADARGIAPGDAFEVRTARGAARFRAVLDHDLAQDVVMASFGWWQACDDLGLGPIDPLGPDHSNMNALVDAEVADGPSGSVPLRSYPCDVRAVAGVRRWRGWKTLTLRRLSHPAEGVIEFELTSPDGAPLPDHRPGQHVRLAFDLPGFARTERFYSLTHGADAAGHTAWRIAVRRGAELSDALHRHVDAQPDAVLTVQAQPPDGHFLLPIAPARPTVLIATGIGITPFLSMLETMAAARPSASTSTSQPMLLLYGNRDAGQHAFASRLAELAHALPALTIIDRYSRSLASADGSTERIERIGRINVRDIGDEWFETDARFYLCGSPTMLREFRDGLRARGVPPFAIFSESFEAASPPPPSGGRFDIHFLRSGRRATWDGSDRSLLAMADRLGIPAAGGCRVGQCESCRVGVRAGQVHHFSDTAVADEGDCLACIAVPASHLEIDL